jgi:ethanolamine ammonia-lyase large subunit
MFQSLAGSQKACDAFGITVQMLGEANALFRERGSPGGEGKTSMYFETGQGSELSSARTTAVTSRRWNADATGLRGILSLFGSTRFVGFMGPEYVYDTKTAPPGRT